jgi:arginase
MVEAVRDVVSRAYREGRFPLVTGGDCPVLLGALAAAESPSKDVELLFEDGHAKNGFGAAAFSSGT